MRSHVTAPPASCGYFYRDLAVLNAALRVGRLHFRLLIALVCGVIAAILIPTSMRPVVRVLLGWNITVWLYLALLWIMMVQMRAERVQVYAAREDESALTALTTVCIAAVASIAAIVLELANAKQAGGGAGAGHILLAASTVIGGWFLIPTVFTLHYARLFFVANQTIAPLIFPDKDLKPDYWDFLYFSFTIAVASQTSDVELASPAMRRMALAQSILAFFFNASILALAINVAAGLV